jgi:hypothetical protein
LAGSFGQTVVRTVTVPASKALFFPIANQFWVNLPDYGDDPWSDAWEAFARAYIAEMLDGIVNNTANPITCEVDGQEIKNLQTFRCQTPDDGECTITAPENNIWGWLPAGTYGPCVDVGVYLMLAPLSAGQHTIRFTATGPDNSWSLDVTYDLTISH